ncbi:MAG TPA: pentapeptide repeat-containing protein [Reyranella sp.]|nr:pentapeptide repeat-containing protein [Reyranella sp.]
MAAALPLAAWPAAADDKKITCSEDDEPATRGNESPPPELAKAIEDHQKWLASGGKSGRQLDQLGGSYRKVRLAGFNLKGARLVEADFSGADLSGADLTEATLDGANFYCADLREAKLKGAALSGANLKKALLNDADLEGAYLVVNNGGAAGTSYAELDRASLIKTKLAGAYMEGANLSRAIFEPKTLPDVGVLAHVSGLETLTYRVDPGALYQLRKKFQDNGLVLQERQLTYALNRVEAERSGPVERAFRTVAFDWTVQYGLNPGRALSIWIGIFVVCWVGYWALVHAPGGSCIYKTGGDGEERPLEPRGIVHGPWWLSGLRLMREELIVFGWCGMFSLMSAVSISFRELDLGRWLRLILPVEIDLRGRGWARSLAGIQSLLGVYLVALWVLSYFGRPFS